MSYYDYNLEELEQLTPFDNFITGIRDEVTRQKYRGFFFYSGDGFEDEQRTDALWRDMTMKQLGLTGYV